MHQCCQVSLQYLLGAHLKLQNPPDIQGQNSTCFQSIIPFAIMHTKHTSPKQQRTYIRHPVVHINILSNYGSGAACPICTPNRYRNHRCRMSLLASLLTRFPFLKLFTHVAVVILVNALDAPLILTTLQHKTTSVQHTTWRMSHRPPPLVVI
jgi:hypothetical protein